MLFPELMVTCMVSPTKANDFLHFNPPREASAAEHQRASKVRRSPKVGAFSFKAVSVSAATASGLTAGRVLFGNFHLRGGDRDRSAWSLLLETLGQSNLPLIALGVSVHATTKPALPFNVRCWAGPHAMHLHHRALCEQER
jgi:hypothetical protein